MVTRRSFFLSPALLGLLFTRRSKANSISSVPILQGATSETCTQINILSETNLTIEISSAFGRHLNFKSEKVKKNFSSWMAYRLVVSDLESDVEYTLRLFNESKQMVDERTFKTLVASKRDFRIALASCMRDTKVSEQKNMWASLEVSDPDILFLLGDNVYVDDGIKLFDRTDEERIWRRYIETRRTLDLYKFKKLLPTLATWDDHDFGKNNTYGNRSWKKDSQAIFRTLYAQDAVIPEVSWGPGIATSYKMFGQQFYLMDDRSFRDGQIFGRTHWGRSQEDWLFEQIGNDSSPGWLFNGSQFFGGYRLGWSFEGNHPKAFRNLLKRLKNTQAPFVFGSGDVHYSEIMKIEKEVLGYESIEITSSSMHSNAKSPVKGNKRRMMSTGEFNFVIVDVSGSELQARSIGMNQKELFNLEFWKLEK